VSTITRRNLLVGGGLATAAAFVRSKAQMAHHLPPMPPAPPLVEPGQLVPFVDALPIPEIAKPSGKRRGDSGDVPYYKIPIQEFFSKIHRDVPPTRFWGYGKSVPGPTIEARSGEEIIVEWPNLLPHKHFLPIDHHLMGAEESLPEVRTVVHVHGARVPPASDGWPEDWYAPGKSAVYHYPNKQEAALLWYHDHAMGINRLNVCAGMAGLYVVRDNFEDALNLPKGEFEIPLVLMDRMFRTDGQLYYPVGQLADYPWVPEYFGNATLLNGKLLPFLEVQPRKYRFRILNASNSLFYQISLDNGATLQQIGTDQGLLRTPVAVGRLTLAPGERADVIIDFAEHAGQHIFLKHLTSTVMQIRVANKSALDSSALPKILRPVTPMPESSAIRTRRLTLEELDNLVGEPMVHLLDGKHWHDPVSEKPVINSTEIWEFINLTDDTHPIHLHLVRFQILDRRPIDVSVHIYNKKLIYLAEPTPPETNEAGWKDTVRATPGASTRIIVKFEGYLGRYVWHCHILEHEDNEMMRPYEVIYAGGGD
jgi:spore coat protein A, manganese oxidase